jgi:Sec23/Sec24 trunk domain
MSSMSLSVIFFSLSCRWRCCMCNMTNEVPQLFDWDQVRNQPGDRWARAELNQSCIEFVAPTEYMVRPPQPAVYVFLIDVSHTAVQSGNLHYFRWYLCFCLLIASVSGMVATATRTILENLDRIPDEDERTKIAIICYDVSLYFFSMPVCSFITYFWHFLMFFFRLGLLIPLCLLFLISKMFFYPSLMTYL